ncbi:HNH endonuclease signature motif containing protein [Corynebacterium glyciniphilum]|uniref:HNH endonuclease signature motif containing protein n=1 Tax=Corynebacterium glyciniphilum TaxID=1404244 RepID=UPI0026530649|nr:HNH endonuclease signature motif containing protein [Corynebacterium glyciniphilum]MDN5683172.1 HNH endonuclease [Corynebacterium glyciniphilum]MDN6706100.1 HNH endonuclease [Corynebacterium glyciniphilum]
MTSTYTTEPTTGESYTSLATTYSVQINTAELELVAFLVGIPEDSRLSTAQAVRRRTTREAYRYAHAADIAERMPGLFDHFRDDGRYSVDHLDAIWSRINRHATALSAAGAEVPQCLDATVALGIADWIATTGITALTALADVADEVLCTVAPLIVEATEQDEAEVVCLTRRGTRFTLDCGSEFVADALWSSLSTAALEVRRDILADQADQTTETAPPSPPSMSRCRGEVVLGVLGGRRDQLNVTVNTYRMRDDAASYILGSGWVSPATGAELTAIARHIRQLPPLEQVPDTDAYRFTTLQRVQIEGRDGHCRFPGCEIPAGDCEHDHLVNSPHTDPDSDGPTSVTNGICLCRTHHTLKTAGVWEPTTPDDAVTLHWHGPGGSRVTTVAAGPLSPVRHPL